MVRKQHRQPVILEVTVPDNWQENQTLEFKYDGTKYEVNVPPGQTVGTKFNAQIEVVTTTGEGSDDDADGDASAVRGSSTNANNGSTARKRKAASKAAVRKMMRMNGSMQGAGARSVRHNKFITLLRHYVVKGSRLDSNSAYTELLHTQKELGRFTKEEAAVACAQAAREKHPAFQGWGQQYYAVQGRANPPFESIDQRVWKMQQNMNNDAARKRAAEAAASESTASVSETPATSSAEAAAPSQGDTASGAVKLEQPEAASSANDPPTPSSAASSKSSPDPVVSKTSGPTEKTSAKPSLPASDKAASSAAGTAKAPKAGKVSSSSSAPSPVHNSKKAAALSDDARESETAARIVLGDGTDPTKVPPSQMLGEYAARIWVVAPAKIKEDEDLLKKELVTAHKSKRLVPRYVADKRYNKPLPPLPASVRSQARPKKSALPTIKSQEKKKLLLPGATQTKLEKPISIDHVSEPALKHSPSLDAVKAESTSGSNSPSAAGAGSVAAQNAPPQQQAEATSTASLTVPQTGPSLASSDRGSVTLPTDAGASASSEKQEIKTRDGLIPEGVGSASSASNTSRPVNPGHESASAVDTTSSQTSTGSHPTTSTQPTTTTQPSTGAQPSTGSQRVTSTQPSTGAQPTTSLQSSMGSQPPTSSQASTSSQPTTSSEPSTGSQPTTTSHPTTTSRPTSTSQPTTASQPTTSSQPTTTSQSTTTSQPATTSQSTTTSQPATSSSQSTTTSQPATSSSQSTTTSQPTPSPAVSSVAEPNSAAQPAAPSTLPPATGLPEASKERPIKSEEPPSKKPLTTSQLEAPVPELSESDAAGIAAAAEAAVTASTANGGLPSHGCVNGLVPPFAVDFGQWVRCPSKLPNAVTRPPSVYPGGRQHDSYLATLAAESDECYKVIEYCRPREPREATARYLTVNCSPFVAQHRLQWLTYRRMEDYAGDKSIIDTLHPDLVNHETGGSLIRSKSLLLSCSPDVKSLIINCSSDPNGMSRVVTGCPNLETVCHVESRISTKLLASLAKHGDRLTGLHFTNIDCAAADFDKAQLAKLLSQCTKLKWLYWTELKLKPRNRLQVFGADCWASLRNNAALKRTLEVLWVDSARYVGFEADVQATVDALPALKLVRVCPGDQHHTSIPLVGWHTNAQPSEPYMPFTPEDAARRLQEDTAAREDDDDDDESSEEEDIDDAEAESILAAAAASAMAQQQQLKQKQKQDQLQLQRLKQAAKRKGAAKKSSGSSSASTQGSSSPGLPKLKKPKSPAKRKPGSGANSSKTGKRPGSKASDNASAAMKQPKENSTNVKRLRKETEPATDSVATAAPPAPALGPHLKPNSVMANLGIKPILSDASAAKTAEPKSKKSSGNETPKVGQNIQSRDKHVSTSDSSKVPPGTQKMELPLQPRLQRPNLVGGPDDETKERQGQHRPQAGHEKPMEQDQKKQQVIQQQKAEQAVKERQAQDQRKIRPKDPLEKPPNPARPKADKGPISQHLKSPGVPVTKSTSAETSLQTSKSSNPAAHEASTSPVAGVSDDINPIQQENVRIRSTASVRAEPQKVQPAVNTSSDDVSTKPAASHEMSEGGTSRSS